MDILTLETYYHRTQYNLDLTRKCTVVQRAMAKVASELNGVLLAIDAKKKTVRIIGNSEFIEEIPVPTKTGTGESSQNPVTTSASTSNVNPSTSANATTSSTGNNPSTSNVNPSTLANATTSSTGNNPSTSNEGGSNGVVSKKYFTWTNKQKTILLETCDDCALTRNSHKSTWTLVEERMRARGIPVTADQCRKEHEYLEKKFKILTKAMPTGSAPRKKEPIDDEIMDHFTRLNSLGTKFTLSSINRGKKRPSTNKNDENAPPKDAEPKKLKVTQSTCKS